MLDTFHDLLLQTLPALKGFALLLTRNRQWAEDLTQETSLRALTRAHQFQPGTNFKAWIFTIMRNQHLDQIRRRRRETQLTDDADALDALMSVRPAQEDGLMLKELLNAVGDLNRGQRETLLLVAGNGLSYEEASKVCGCPVGTIRSRLARARQTLQDRMMGPAPEGPHQPAIARSGRRPEWSQA